MKTKVLFLMAVGLVLSGCNAQLQDYVNGTVPILPSSAPVVQQNSLGGIKMSPGAMQSKGTTNSATAHMTPTGTQMKGSTVSMQVGISRAPTHQ